jgi:hypothetical protein
MSKTLLFGTFLAISVVLAGCGKNSGTSNAKAGDPCSNAAGSQYQTQEQAAEECRNRHKMSDEPDPKPSNTVITNH